MIALFLKAYSLGGGTYTGIEAVSNNVNMLKEPRVRTGKWTMFLMALSLSLTAGGIILLYLLWDVPPSHDGRDAERRRVRRASSRASGSTRRRATRC